MFASQGLKSTTTENEMPRDLELFEDERRELFSSERHAARRESGTELALTGEYVERHQDGSYQCVALGDKLFSSDAKFDSGSLWQSFAELAVANAVELHRDRSFEMERTEGFCRACGSHLGHVFDNRQRPTGQLYCSNSLSIDEGQR